MDKIVAGAGRVDITPKLGTQIGGDIGRRRPTEKIIEPLFANSLVLESGGKKFCLLSLDLCVMTTDWADKLRLAVSEKFGFEKSAVMLHLVQNHSAPYLGHAFQIDRHSKLPKELTWLKGGNDDYHPFVVEKALCAVDVAMKSKEPVSVSCGSGIEGRIAFNRRGVMRDGKGRMHPPTGSPDILYIEGPIDPEVGVVCFMDESQKKKAMLLSFTSHPCHCFSYNAISYDWPGAWAYEMQRRHGEDCVPLVINGCCGNIHHANHLDPNHEDTYQKMGRVLADDSEKIMTNMTKQDNLVLDYKSEILKIPYRKYDENMIREAEELIRNNPDPMWIDKEHTRVEWKWVYALSRLDMRDEIKSRTHFDYEVQVVRIGDIAIVGIGGEPFVEGQLRIKLGSPVRHTYVVHMSNVYAGYVPTAKAIENGGFETEFSNWSKLCPPALDMIADKAVAMLKEIFR